MTDRQEDARGKLWTLITNIRFAMFTTRRPDGGLQSRPMTTLNRDGDDLDFLWFFAARDSEQVADLQWESSVNIAYAEPKDDRYLSVSGSASVVEDPERKKQLWSPFVQAWFPGGPEDPEVALIRVRITQADYWDVTDNKLTQLFKLAQAVVTGKPAVRMGDSGSVPVS